MGEDMPRGSYPENPRSLPDVISDLAIETMQKVVKQGRKVAETVMDNSTVSVRITVENPAGRNICFTAKREIDVPEQDEKLGVESLRRSLEWVQECQGQARFSHETKAHLQELAEAAKHWLAAGSKPSP